ncbi:MAG TPA: hypothetical protein VK787_06940 [Puia sp.]|jgi:hypothetical protein|nr:hypothetical protein [Puia sp.]
MQSLISNIAIASCYLPVLMIVWKNLRYEKSLIAIAIYWLFSGLINLHSWVSFLQNSAWQNQITLIYNLLDGPLILLFFFFSANNSKRKMILYTIISFILFEIATIIITGYNLKSSTIIIGFDTFIALTLCITNITAYLSKLDHSSCENALVFINSSILFSYGVFIIIYFFSYLGFASTKTEKNEVFLIYYISLFLSSLLTCYGLWRYTKKPSPMYERSHLTY